jgi:ABC-2 type transport system ATP-binding protein
MIRVTAGRQAGRAGRAGTVPERPGRTATHIPGSGHGVRPTHYLEEADANANRIIVVNRGRVIADGTPAQVKSYTATRRIRFTMPAPDPAVLLGLPGALDVHIDGGAVTISSGDADATLPALYALGRPVKGMEVGGGGLEEALLAMTSDDNGAGNGTQATTERVD